MVVVAFLVPLALMTRTLAHDRALEVAERDTRTIAPVLALDADTSVIEALLSTTSTGSDDRLGVLLANRLQIGAVPTDQALTMAAAASGTSSRRTVRGGAQVDTPVALADGRVAVISAFVPTALLNEGVLRAWVGLAFVGLALVVVASVVASRLARALVRPVSDLAYASMRLGAGDLTVRITPSGPPELVVVAETFNRLVGQVESLLRTERESVADLAHRLRTPLTALRIDAESVAEPEQAQRIIASVDRLTVALNRVIEEARRPSSALLAKPCRVSEVVIERIAHWAPLFDDLDRPLAQHVEPGLVTVIDAERLAEAVDLLVENVLQHTPEGTAVEVSARRRSNPDGIDVTVHDGGPGIGSDSLERGRSGGGSTGLGLDIVRSIVRAAGGDLVIATGHLGGAAVTIRLTAHGGRAGNRTQDLHDVNVAL